MLLIISAVVLAFLFCPRESDNLIIEEMMLMDEFDEED